MSKNNIECIYPLSPMQQGMLFNSLFALGSGVEIEQIICTIREPLDFSAFCRAWSQVISRHPVLRTRFQWINISEPRACFLRALRPLILVLTMLLF
jgi:hypothetical protein